MKIIHVVESFVSGVAAFVESLVENMNDDFHIIIYGEREGVFQFDQIKKNFRGRNVRFIKWQSAQRNISLKKDSAAFIELYKLIKQLKAEKQADAVHLHSSKSGFLGRLVCRILNIQNAVYTPNGAPFLSSSHKLKNYLYKVFEKMGHSFGGQVVCCSGSELKVYRDIGINAMNINNGVSVKKMDQFGIPKKKSKFRIVTSARIVQQKNPFLFNRIATYFKDFDQFEFIWVGDGEDRHLLKSPNIRITGWLPSNKAREIIGSADVYLSTSNFEGLSFSVLEALALRRPVLLTDCIGNRDMVKKGSNGDLFRNEEEANIKLLQYFNNPDMLHVMGANSMQFCKEEFDVRSTYRLYRNLYSRNEMN